MMYCLTTIHLVTDRQTDDIWTYGQTDISMMPIAETAAARAAKNCTHLKR